MESLSRPFHRRKLSNANGKNAYEGVFSVHRPKFDGAPTVNVDEYREIFSNGQTVSSIPILDLSNLNHQQDEDEASDGFKPDYDLIFGGFRESEIAASYQELIARDKDRAPSSTNQSSQDFDDQSHHSFDALKQFNMSYNKISQRSKDGLDGTTHVTQLYAVPGFTCFIDESTSQPNKESENQKSSVTNNVPDKQTSQNVVESRSKHHQDNSLSGDKSSMTFQNDIKLHPSEVLSPPVASSTNNEASSQPQKEIEKQKSSVADNIYPSVNSRKVDFHAKQTSLNALECKELHQDNSLSGDKNSKTWQTDINAYPTKVSSSPAASSVNNETSCQLMKETEKQKSSVTNDVHPSVNNGKFDFHEKQTSRSAAESKSKERSDESLSDDRNLKTFQADLKSNPSKISSLPPVASATNSESSSQPKKKTEEQNSSVTNDIYSSVSNSKLDCHEKQTSRSAVESKSKDCPDESLSDHINLKTSQADLKSHPSNISLPPRVASATNVDSHEGYQRRSTATSTGTHKSDTSAEFPPTCFSEELDVNSDAAISAAALRKAIEKAQESIRIAKESVGRKKEGLRGYSSKSFKDSLKVKAKVSNVRTVEEQKEKDDKMKASRIFSNGSSHRKHGGTVGYSEFVDGERLFGAKVINEIRGKIPESAKNSEMPVSRSHELREDKNVCNSKEAVVEKLSSESIENITYEASQRDSQRSNGYFVIESREKKLEDPEDKIENDKARESNEKIDEVRPTDSRNLVGDLNNLTLYHEVEDERNDQNGYEKSFNETLGLLENMKQEVLEKERDENVVSAESDDEASEKVLEDEGELKDTESRKEEDTGEKFYDVCEVEMIENTPTSANSLGTNEVSPEENENHKEEKPFEELDKFEEPQIYENSSSDYDDAEESESVHGFNGANHIVFDTQRACKVDQNDNTPESGPEIDDVRCSSAQEFQVEDTEAIEKDIFEDISADQTSSEDNEDECDDVLNGVLADVGFGRNDVRSGSSSDTIHGMEIEVKEYKEREETVVSLKEEKNNLQQSHEETPGIRLKMETGTSQEQKDESEESGPSKVVEKGHTKSIKEVTAEERERERVKLAAERAIREARERAFAEARDRAERAAVERANAEVRQRVLADAQEKVLKTSAQSKLKAERAAVERATAEARQRALEKAMSQKKSSEPRVQVNEVKQTSSVSHTNVESALRSKAKLEKHNRIMERAAKALAEKEKRDMLVLKEQAERSRLADNLDADIKRWSTGKEGNLRALLSTLQYILGAESGWQPVSLTEIITTTAVKRAYRKATLCVHPDKLQQRGASIQQKYICEKVFDLLKAAWNRFNSEER